MKILINGEKRDISWLGTYGPRGRQITLRKDLNDLIASENSIRKLSEGQDTLSTLFGPQK